jgi:hypothetical protein
MEVEISKNIDAPPEVVWHYLVDWERLGNWMKEASKFRVTSPHREGVGVEADAIIRIGWLSTIDPIRVARWEPPELLEIEHRGWVKGTGVSWYRSGPAGPGSASDQGRSYRIRGTALRAFESNWPSHAFDAGRPLQRKFASISVGSGKLLGELACG